MNREQTNYAPPNAQTTTSAYVPPFQLTAMAFAGLAPAGRSGRRSVGGGGPPRTLEPDVRRASIRAGLLPLGSEGPPPRRHLTGEQ